MPRNKWFLYLILTLSYSISAQNLLPPVFNYNVYDYNAAGQNWGLTVNDNGELFSANDNGLLAYNGEEWILKRLPNATIIRSVKAINDRVYTGSYEEFGYWKKDEFGILNYNSLTHLIKGHTFTNEEFWQITPYKNAVVFRSFSTIYWYENHEIRVINPKAVVTNIATDGTEIYMALRGLGLGTLVDYNFEPIVGVSELKEYNIIDIEPFNNGLLIGTQLNGCFVLKNDVLKPLNIIINPFLQQYQLNRILPLSQNEIAFGTIKNGVYIYNLLDKSVEHFNRETGLQNNTVLAMSTFRNQLWTGLENGIDRILLESSINYYTDYSGNLGTVHDIAISNDSTYLGSNTGIYYFKNNEIEFFEGSQGHTWDVEVVDKDVLAGHNSGTFKIDGQKIAKISDQAGGYQFVKVPDKVKTYLQGTYTGIAKFERASQGGFNVSKINGIDFPIKQLCFENSRTLWAAHSYKGLFRIVLDDSLTSVVSLKSFDTTEVPNLYNIELVKIKNHIAVQSGGEWFKFDPLNEELSAFEELNLLFDNANIYADGEHFWFIDEANSKGLLYTDLNNTSININQTQLNQRLVPDLERVYMKNDSIFYITLFDGFARVNLAKLKRDISAENVPVPQLDFFKDAKQYHRLKNDDFVITYPDSRDLHFKFSSASLVAASHNYELSGPIVFNGTTKEGTIQFQNLPHGQYSLSVYTVNVGNNRSLPKLLSFQIEAPWYWNLWSILCYLAALMLLVIVIRWHNNRKLKRKQDILKARLQREQREQLALFKKERLEREIKLKQKELVRTTMSVAKKNELLLEIKDMLVLNKHAFTNKQRLHTLSNKLDTSLNKKENWKQFEVNFKELHEDFFENLLNQYPRLTPKDLKLSAYLKMNLSTKEIAPLLGISVRGVEIHRYRLRKKLNLKKTENLSNFLIMFN